MALKKLIALLVTAAGVAVLQAAETVYKTVWEQDFEDAKTYAAEVRPGWYARTSDLEIVQGNTTPINQAERMRVDGTTSKFLRISRSGKNEKTSLIYDFPSIVSASTVESYRVSWWQFLGQGYANYDPPYSYFQIVGNKGLLAVIELRFDKYDADVNVYNAAGEAIGKIRVAARGNDPATNANWNQFVVTCDEDGVRLDVFDRDGVKKIDGALLSASIDQIKLLSHELCVSSKIDYSHNAGIDDVIVELPASAGETFTWTGVAGDGLWSNPANWTVDGEVPLAAPTEADAVTIAGGEQVIYVTPDIAYKSLVLGEGVKLALLLSKVTELTEVFTLPTLADGEKLAADRVLVCGPYEQGLSEDGLSITAKRVPSVFTWVAAEGVWQLAANWQVGELMSGALPGEDDEVVFPTTVSLRIDAAPVTVSRVTVEEEAVLTLSGAYSLLATNFGGAGLLKLANARIGNKSGAATTIEVNLEIVAETENTIFVGNGGGITSTFSGKLTGAGRLLVNEGAQNSAGLAMSGDQTSFAGEFLVTNPFLSTQRSTTRFESALAASALAAWTVKGTGRDNIFRSSNETYYFGALNGSVNESSTYLGIVLEIGARNEDCGFDGCLSRGDDVDHRNYGTKVRKVGTAKLTLDTTNTGTVEINGGTVAFKQTAALPHANDCGDYWLQFGGGTLETTAGVDPSALIKKSTYPISVSVVDAEANETWASVLESSNVGGLVKKGTGTLTLAEVPAYTGVTTVEAGELVVPEGSRIHWDILSAGALTGVQPTSYNYQLGTTNVYDSAAAVPSAGNHTLNLDNLIAIDLTSVTTVEKGATFVIAEAKAFNVGGKAITKAGREKIALIWGKDTVFP